MPETYWDVYLPKDRVKYSDDDDSAIWPSEPDVNAIKTIVASEIFKDPGRHDDPELRVRFLADGAYHRVYEATHPSWTTSYLLRVAVPVVTALKTESEMATLAYIRDHTSIHVPKPIAWSSSRDNTLGYEWSLLEKIPGVELASVWRKIPWVKKVALVRQLAGYMAQLWSIELHGIGSLFFARTHQSRKHEGTFDTPQASRQHGKFDDSTSYDYKVGPAVDTAFYLGRRRYLPVPPQAFNQPWDWLKSHVTYELLFLESAKALLGTRDEAPAEYRDNDEAWEDMVENEIGVDSETFLGQFEDLKSLCQAYHDLVYDVLAFSSPEDYKAFQKCFRQSSMAGWKPFKTRKKCVTYLSHHDLSQHNILVDPDTFAITGIIDWESTMVMPQWASIRYPLFLDTRPPFDDTEPPIPATYDTESELYNGPMVTNRDHWDGKLLRAEFDAALEQADIQMTILGPKYRTPLDNLKSAVRTHIGDISGFPRLAINMLRSIKSRREQILEQSPPEFRNAMQEVEIPLDMMGSDITHAMETRGKTLSEEEDHPGEWLLLAMELREACGGSGVSAGMRMSKSW